MLGLLTAIPPSMFSYSFCQTPFPSSQRMYFLDVPISIFRAQSYHTWVRTFQGNGVSCIAENDFNQLACIQIRNCVLWEHYAFKRRYSNHSDLLHILLSPTFDYRLGRDFWALNYYLHHVNETINFAKYLTEIAYHHDHLHFEYWMIIIITVWLS